MFCTPVLQRKENSDRTFVINKEIVELGKKKELENLLEFIAKEEKQFSNVNYATAMSQLGRIRSFDGSDPRFLTFLDSLSNTINERGLPWIKVREASNIVYGIGKMQLNNNQSAKNILDWMSQAKIAKDFVEKANAQDISNAVWAFATLGIPAPALFANIEAHSNRLFKEGKPQDVAITAWAFATLGIEAPKLFAAIEAHSDWLVKEGNPQDGSNTAWALATLRTQAPKLFAHIEAHSEWFVKEGNPQAVANTAWAFATLGVEAPKMFGHVESCSEWFVKNGTPQTIANTAWAFPTLGVEAPKMFGHVEACSEWFVKNGDPQAVANTAWAFATLGTPAPKLFARIEACSKWFVKEGKPQEVANTAWAFATLGIPAPKLFADIEAHSNWLVKNGNPQNVANTAWAFATLGFDAPNFYAALDSISVEILAKDLIPQSVTILCYAVSIAGRSAQSEELFSSLWAKAIELFESKAKFSDDELRQLAQTQIFAKVAGVELAQCPDSMSKEIKRLMVEKRAEDNVTSRSAEEVSKILKEIGFEHELEVSPDISISGGMLAIDYACKERKVAIEYDGEYHFLKAVESGELTTMRNGRTKAKRRLLEQLGWTVISLDYRGYINACHKSNEKQWLRNALKEAGVVLPYF